MPHKNDNGDTEDQEENVDMEEQQDLAIMPLVTFGVLTDIQFANADDGLNYDKTRMRYYRNSINMVSEAVRNWKLHEANNNCQFKFVLQLGDLIDGKAKKINDSIPSMNKVLTELEKLFDGERPEPKLLHIWGNHEFYNFTRQEIVDLPLNTAKALGQNVHANANYYAYQVTDKLRLVCLDFYEFSTLGYDEDHAVYKAAYNLLRTHNKNEDLNSVEGLRGHAMRFSKFNGSIGESQTKWFEDQLKSCKQSNTNVIVCGHLPIHAQASDPRCLAWDSKELLELIWSYGRTVIAYFAGHDHCGGYFRDKHNIHHLTFPAILETPANSNAYATVKVFDNKVSVEGVGMVGYYEIYFE